MEIIKVKAIKEINNEIPIGTVLEAHKNGDMYDVFHFSGWFRVPDNYCEEIKE